MNCLQLLIDARTILFFVLINANTIDGQCTFGVGLSSGGGSSASLLPFDTIFSNVNSSWSSAYNYCRMNIDYSFNFVEVCLATVAYRPGKIQNIGSYPPFVNNWLSTRHNGMITNCRTSMVKMTKGVRLGANSGGTTLDGYSVTSIASFSVTDSMQYASQLFASFAAQPYDAYSIIAFPNILINADSGQFNSATNTYQVLWTGPHFISFSADVMAGSMAQLMINGLSVSLTAERLDTNTDGPTSLSRTVLLQANAGDQISLAIDFGSITSVPANQISLIVFPYQLKGGLTSVAWSAFKSETGPVTDVLDFDVWNVYLGFADAPFTSKTTVQAPLAGVYYLYMSVGAKAGQTVNLGMKRNGDILFSIVRRSTSSNGVDTMTRGMVVRLNAGDSVSVVSDEWLEAYSQPFGCHTSFGGMLLYAATN